jgi:hypothetical protein
MIAFDIDKHKYTKDTEEYISATTLIGRFKQPFDAIPISEKYALKHPEKTAAEWRAEWKAIGKETAEYGTMVHAELEEKVKQDPRYRDAVRLSSDTTIHSLSTLSELEDGLYPELMVWSDRYRIAGQIDLVEIVDGVANITDYKTYKKVDLKSFYNPKTKEWKCMLEPLHGLQDCNYNHAGLQTSLYAHILEEAGYKIGKLTMIHIDRNGHQTPYSIPYSQFKMFVQFMLMNYTNGNK